MARQRGNSWQAGIKLTESHPEGPGYPRYSFATEALALDWERAAKAARKAGEPIPVPSRDENSRPTLRSFYKANRDVIWSGKLPRNVESNQRACERFLGKETPLHHIHLKRLTQMVADMKRAGNAPGTINTRLSHLKVLLRYAKSLDLVDEDLQFPWVAKGDNQRDRFLTVEEERKLLDLFNHWGLFEVEQLIATLIDTGCRPSELIHAESLGDPIRWSEVSELAGGSAVDAYDPSSEQSRAAIYIKRTKTGKKGERTLVLTDRAKNAFLASKQRGDKRPFGSIRSDDLSAHVRKAADHLGMNDVVLYTMRHTCASRLVQRGADLFRVSKWMGHTNIKTTQRYAHLVPTDIFELGGLL